jgi:serine/threonine protein kinase
MLGRGSSKIVRLGNLEGTRVAILSPRPHVNLVAEKTYLEMFRGRHSILQLVSTAYGNDYYESTGNLIVELAPFGSVQDLVDDLEFENRTADLSDSHIDVIVRQIECAVGELCARGLRHNDLSPRNILVFAFNPRDPEATRVKLADFGDVCAGERDSIDALRREIENMR